MRTSKLAQDTSKLMSALSSGPRRSLRVRASLDKQETRGDSNDTDSSNTLSDPPPVVSRKRKRDTDASTPATSTTTAKRESSAEVAFTPRARRGRRMPAKKVKDEDGNVRIEPPANWEIMYKLTQEMRRNVIAPVDHQGCESLADTNMSPRDQRYQTLTALMLSSQTKDQVTAAAIGNLQRNLPGGLSIESILAVEPARLNELIGKVGFHNLKTKYIKNTALILRDEWGGDIPDTIEGMISLPGVGPKMAYLCMSSAWGRDEGIGVDVHVHRITNLFGWQKTNQPEETRATLEAWLPRDKWHEINHLLVGFGQTICLPVGRKCGECLLADRGLCPGAVVAKLNKKVTVVKREVLPKIEIGVEETVKTDTVVQKTEEMVEEVNIKAEDLHTEGVAGDIEDIGQGRTSTVK